MSVHKASLSFQGFIAMANLMSYQLILKSWGLSITRSNMLETWLIFNSKLSPQRMNPSFHMCV